MLWLARTFILPAGMYGCQVWSTKWLTPSMCEKTTVHKRMMGVMKRCLQVRHSVSNWCVLREVGCKPMCFYWFRCVMRFWNSLIDTNSTLIREVVKADLALADRRVDSWSFDVLKGLKWLPAADALRFSNDIKNRRNLNLDDVVKCWLSTCNTFVQNMSSGQVTDPDVCHRKLVTYQQWFAHDGNNCDFQKVAQYLKGDIRSSKVVALARFRLSAHHLFVEVGRWHGVKFEERVCDHVDCRHNKEVQNEEHALFRCGMTAELRTRFPQLFAGDAQHSMQSFWQKDIKAIASYVTCCMAVYDRHHFERFGVGAVG